MFKKNTTMTLEQIQKENVWTDKYLDVCSLVNHFEDLVLKGEFSADSQVSRCMVEQQKLLDLMRK